jgi:hypothetical protein
MIEQVRLPQSSPAPQHRGRPDRRRLTADGLLAMDRTSIHYPSMTVMGGSDLVTPLPAPALAARLADPRPS